MADDILSVKEYPGSIYMRRGKEGLDGWGVTRETGSDIEYIRGDIVRASAARAAFMWHHLTERAGLALAELKGDCEANCRNPGKCDEVEHCYIRSAMDILKKMTGEG